MKNTVVLLLFFITLIACHPTTHKKTNKIETKKDSISHPWKYLITDILINSPYDTLPLLKMLFGPVKIVNKVAYWKPDGDACFNIWISPDGFCHTAIDTIIKMKSAIDSFYLVLFATARPDSDFTMEDDVDYGMALIDIFEGKFRAKNFLRNFTHVGGNGEGADSISLDNFGNNLYALHITSSTASAGGPAFIYEDFFDVNDAHLIFSYCSSYSTVLMCDSTSGNYAETEKKLVHIPMRGHHDKLKLEITDSHFDTVKNKMITLKTEEYYQILDKKLISYYQQNENHLLRYERVLK